jgi:hypothetical protein
MSTLRRLSLALAFTVPLTVALAPDARAGEPQTVSSAEEEALYKQERALALPVKDKATAGPSEKFAVEGCFADPSKCKCQNNDAAKSTFCGTMLGHFCPDSTLRYLAAACMDLFGGATLCQCAAKQQIESYIKAEDAAKAKAEKDAAKKAKKKGGTKAPAPK